MAEKLRFPKLETKSELKPNSWLRTPSVTSEDFKESLNSHSNSVDSKGTLSFIESTFFKYGLGRDCTQSVLQMGLSTPTQVQDLVIPKIMAGKNISLIAQTGTGKTLAYALPIVDALVKSNNEKLAPYVDGRVRCIVMVPSRELAKQVMKVFRGLKISSISCAAGQSFLQEARDLRNGVDVVIGTPNRLLLHYRKGHLAFSKLSQIVMDEADVLSGQCYIEDVVEILGEIKGLPLHTDYRARQVLLEAKSSELEEEGVEDTIRRLTEGDAGLERKVRIEREKQRRTLEKDQELKAQWGSGGPQMVLVAATKTATLTDFMKRNLRQSSVGTLAHPLLTEKSEGGEDMASSVRGWKLDHVVSSDAHLVASNLQQVFLPLHGQTRIARLLEALSEHGHGDSLASTMGSKGTANSKADLSNKIFSGVTKKKTIVFVNSVRTARYVSMNLKESGIANVCVDSFISFKERNANIHKFKSGKANILVCTGLLSYGIDIPDVEHVVMFDFPYTLADYLHRAGRTARAGDVGRVTTIMTNRHLPLVKEIQNASRVAAPLDMRYATRTMKKLMKLEAERRKLWEMKYKNKLKMTRRRMGLGPIRKTGPIRKFYQQQMHFRVKGQKKLDFLRRRGRLSKHELLPKRPNAGVENMDAQEFNSVIRNADGLIQVIPKRRGNSSSGVQKRRAGKYDDKTVPLEGAPTFQDEQAGRENRAVKKSMKHKPWF